MDKNETTGASGQPHRPTPNPRNIAEPFGQILRRITSPGYKTVPPPTAEEIARQQAEEKECHRQEIAQSLNVDLEHRFEVFADRPGLGLSRVAVQSWAEGTGKPLCLVYGPPGNGKTHLCEAAAIRLYQRGIFARVISWPTLASSLRDAMTPREGQPGYEDRLRAICELPVLILDDLGAGSQAGPWQDSVIETVMVTRYGRELRTLITTNRDLRSLPLAVQSRFGDTRVSSCILNEASDYRRLR